MKILSVLLSFVFVLKFKLYFIDKLFFSIDFFPQTHYCPKKRPYVYTKKLIARVIGEVYWLKPLTKQDGFKSKYPV